MSMEYRSSIPQGAGKWVEREMLGKTREDFRTKIEYQPYPQAMASVRERQSGDPSDPAARFANDVHATIATIMGLKDYSLLKFYTAIGSPLDQFHSIDGFFELTDPDRPDEPIVVTVDITMNPEKETYQADHIILVPRHGLDPKDDKKEFAALVQETAEQITKIFESQMAAVA